MFHVSKPPEDQQSGSTPQAELRRGARDQVPILLGVIPFGLIFGALALANGVGPMQAQALSLLVFAGSAQFIAVDLIGSGASAWLVVATIFVVNLRHMLYSATLAPHLRQLSLGWKAVLSWLLTDEAFATTSVRYRLGARRHAHWYLLGTGLTLWAGWQLSTAAGILVGAGLPAEWSLDFALPLTFLALLMPSLVDRAAVVAAVGAGALSIVLWGLPLRLGLLVATLTGVVLGLLVSTRDTRSQSPHG